MRVYYSKKQILNPITGNVIHNNSSNRLSVVKQIQNFRQRYPFEGQTILTKTKADKILRKKNLELEEDVTINQWGGRYRGIGYLGKSAMATVNKKGPGRPKKSDKAWVEQSLESATGGISHDAIQRSNPWRADSIGTTRFFWDPDSNIAELVVVACSNRKIWDEENPIVDLMAVENAGLADSNYEFTSGPGKPTAQQSIANAYSSPLFKKSIDWAVNRDIPVNVMSAKYGLMGEGAYIYDYDKTISDMSKEQKKNWSEAVAKSIIERTPTGSNYSVDIKPKKVYLLAGKAYTNLIAPKLREAGIEVVEPLEGMQIGERLQYLKEDNKAFKELGLQRDTPLTWRSGVSDLKWRKGDRYQKYPNNPWGFTELYDGNKNMTENEFHANERKKQELALKKELGQ